ncbi:hypothetical protein AX774_g2047 [Zancudomyces culisetae]|uniref:Uncharacterized protein n=1 Tax=Zancudomyces culisetae TaxID=1213189 RepID=A0A1R1PU03_ZANCU|nr:hypothetical protein AX774_g2047 [Zancudomyces culisetae]|eukprot:OMH84427.1 hypothetical protein AX774_g2047 [Zancudomyces culisetae]
MFTTAQSNTSFDIAAGNDMVLEQTGMQVINSTRPLGRSINNQATKCLYEKVGTCINNFCSSYTSFGSIQVWRTKLYAWSENGGSLSNIDFQNFIRDRLINNPYGTCTTYCMYNASNPSIRVCVKVTEMFDCAGDCSTGIDFGGCNDLVRVGMKFLSEWKEIG